METVLITGASSGIGRELAKCFAADGCCLVLVARRGSALESLAGELRKNHRVDARVVVADLAGGCPNPLTWCSCEIGQQSG